jgi:hypothetical protein
LRLSSLLAPEKRGRVNRRDVLLTITASYPTDKVTDKARSSTNGGHAALLKHTRGTFHRRVTYNIAFDCGGHYSSTSAVDSGLPLFPPATRHNCLAHDHSSLCKHMFPFSDVAVSLTRGWPTPRAPVNEEWGVLDINDHHRVSHVGVAAIARA